MNERIHATYLVETAYDIRAAIEVMAGEQSSGTFVALPGETAELKERFGARIERLDVVGESDRPSLPGAGAPGPVWRRAEVELSWPLDVVGVSLPAVMATVAGNLFELKQISGLRLTGITLPDAFAKRYPGPAFGVDGTRRLAGVEGRPLIGTIVKPSVGLTPAATAELVGELAEGGIDFIKDDELQADGPACPFDERVRAVMQVLNENADRAGKKVMYAFNITGELDEMRHRHDLVAALGGSCVMASLNSVGLVGMIELRRHCRLPIHAHRNGWGYLSRHPLLGWDYPAWATLWRLAGCDHLHVNGIRNKFCEPDASVVRSARFCLTPLHAAAPNLVMPVFSSGQTVRTAHDTFAALGSTDLIFAAGGGLMAHPGGPRAGVAALRQAWEAAIRGIPAEAHARGHRELAEALAAFPA